MPAKSRKAATKPISSEDLAALRALGHRAGRRDAVSSLLLYHRDGVRAVPLAEGEQRIIGRESPADVVIRDGSLSRRHALVELVDGTLWVEDLGSTNGTWVNGEQIERASVDPRADLAFGAVAATVHAATAAEARRLGLDGHERFVEDLEAEVARARYFGRSVALVMVRPASRDGGAAGRWVRAVSRLLRPFDRAALYATDTVEVRLPEVSLDEARDRTEAIVLGAREPLQCGVALFPDHASSAGELLEVARRALYDRRASDAVRIAPALRQRSPEPASEPGSGPVIRSEAMGELFATVDRLAAKSIPVLIRGETGTGKEVVAQAIHDRSGRSGPMVCVNCAAIPDQLVESTLFGHVEGAFTGATSARAGVFESADDGTVFLDEIGELPAAVQAALLRVLETKRVTRVGASDEQAVDVRIVAATHRDLGEMVRTGGFREDLLYRLNVMTLEVPPLRERPDDVEALVEHFLGAARDAGECDLDGVADDAMALLRQHAWPGNVRELRNAVERAAVIATGSEITVEDLPETIRSLEPAKPPAEPVERGTEPAKDAPPVATPESDEGQGLRDQIRRVEADMILRALHDADWDRRTAAERLDLPLRTLAHKMRQHGIRIPKGRGR